MEDSRGCHRPQGATIRLRADGKKRDVDVHVDVHGEDIAKDAKVSLPGVPTIVELKSGFIEALQSDTTPKIEYTSIAVCGQP